MACVEDFELFGRGIEDNVLRFTVIILFGVKTT